MGADLVEDVEAVAHGLLRVSLRALAAVDSVSTTQLRVLMLLHDIGPVNLSVLADGLGGSVSSASRLIDRLTAAGHVERTTPSHTRRELLLRLSPSGCRIVRRHQDVRRAVFADLMEQLSEDERDCLLTGLRAVDRVTRRQSEEEQQLCEAPGPRHDPRDSRRQ